VIFLAIFSVVVAIAAIAGHVHHVATRWESPVCPFECYECRHRFKTAQHYVAHMHGNHGVDFHEHEVQVLKGYRLDGGS